ncbi:MAG: fluoride efflux transporter CrcB [Methylococcaceae bacterium]|nr:fluoride efflux transporter CrcB [Methylococcaceae bacterium]
MTHIIAIALGGASGSVLRFLVSSGIYQWLGKGFPYGTLAVNVIGSFLIGLLAEALILQRIAMALEFRAAILVGVLGGFTTFSSFSLETLYLLEQGSFSKAAVNVIASIGTCLLAVWVGLLCGRWLFHYDGGVIQWQGGVFPYALIIVNALIAFIIGMVAAILLQKVVLSMEERAIILVVIIGAYFTLSGLYLVLFMIEHGLSFDAHLNVMLSVFVGNALMNILVLWMGLLTGKQI